MNKHLKKIVILSLGVTLCIPVSLRNIHAKDASTDKEEVVYVNLDSAGKVTNIDVVNIFENSNNIVDYGKYSKVKVMNTTDEINYENNEVTISTDAEKIYYQGTLESDVIPWNIDVHYILDGTEVSADEVSGASGSLKIDIDISKNGNYKGTFFESYALQVVLSLSTELCKNIEAEGATIANVGTDKQVTFTVLPNTGANLEVSAVVEDFECDAIAINGVPLSLDIAIDEDQFMEQIYTLQDAIQQLNDGTTQLSDGTGQILSGSGALQNGVDSLQNGMSALQSGTSSLQNGTSSVNSGANSVAKGADDLADGIEAFQDGIDQIQNALDTLNSNSSTLNNASGEIKAALKTIQSALNSVDMDTSSLSQLVSGSAQVKSGIDELNTGAAKVEEGTRYSYYYNTFKNNGLDIDELRSGNAQAITELSRLTNLLNQSISTLEVAGVDTTLLNDISSSLSDINLLLTGNNALIDNTKTYFDTLNSNVRTLSQGCATLKSNYTKIDDGIQTLASTVNKMASDMKELKSGINTLTGYYDQLNSGINDYTSGLGKIINGYEQLASNYSAIVNGSKTLASGTNTLYSGTSDLLSGVASLYSGTSSLYDGSGKLNSGVAELILNLETLYNGTKTLDSGAGTLNGETSSIDTVISDSIADIVGSITGGDYDLGSFVSSDNTSVSAVQFVIQIPAIEKKAEEKEEKKEEHLNFWQKLLRLFGLY